MAQSTESPCLLCRGWKHENPDVSKALFPWMHIGPSRPCVDSGLLELWTCHSILGPSSSRGHLFLYSLLVVSLLCTPVFVLEFPLSRRHQLHKISACSKDFILTCALCGRQVRSHSWLSGIRLLWRIPFNPQPCLLSQDGELGRGWEGEADLDNMAIHLMKSCLWAGTFSAQRGEGTQG